MRTDDIRMQEKNCRFYPCGGDVLSAAGQSGNDVSDEGNRPGMSFESSILRPVLCQCIAGCQEESIAVQII
jgi:hypothetical protein